VCFGGELRLFQLFQLFHLFLPFLKSSGGTAPATQAARGS
jgi:hypothetical protein